MTRNAILVNLQIQEWIPEKKGGEDDPEDCLYKDERFPVEGML